MFEAVITVCAILSGDVGQGTVCRDQLLPGYEAISRAACTDNLAGAKGLPDGKNLRCQESGEVLVMIEAAPGVFVHEGRIEEPDQINRGDVSNLGFVIGQNSVAVIDTGTARWMGEALWRSIRQRTDLPVTHVVLTHMHPDHVLGTATFVDAGAEVVGHANLSRALADRQDNYLQSLVRLVGAEAFLGTEAVMVDVAVQGSMVIDLGGRALQVRAWPAAHTGTDITVFDNVTGTFFAGDLVFDRHAPALDGKLTGWRAVLSEIEGMKINQLVPGHGGPVLDWPEGGANLARYLDVLESDTRAAVDRGDRLGDAVDIIAQGEATFWELFDAYNARNATVAFTELEWE